VASDYSCGEIVCKCIQVVYQGEVWATSKEIRFALDALADDTRADKSSKGRTLLTKREEGVVHLVSEGMTNRDISRLLNLSEHTVRNYLFRIFNKVGTSNRLELALYAISKKHGEYEERDQQTQGYYRRKPESLGIGLLRSRVVASGLSQ